MKKVSYIVIGLFILAVTSCQKEVIAPLSHTDASEVEWKSDETKDQGSSVDSRSNGSNKSLSTSSGESDSSGGGSGAITDPNNDPDANKKKGKI